MEYSVTPPTVRDLFIRCIGTTRGSKVNNMTHAEETFHFTKRQLEEILPVTEYIVIDHFETTTNSTTPWSMSLPVIQKALTS